MITIITPSFNQAQFLEQTIKSVLSQECPGLEYCIVDGASTDRSVEIIKKYESSLIYWVSEADNGQSQAINKGINRANGQIINWLNSDDYYEPNKLSEVVKLFSKKDISAVCGRSRLFNVSGTVSYSRGTDIYKDNLPKTIGWARMDQPETFFSKEAWDQVGLLNEALHYCMDREWWIRYLYHFGFSGIVKTDHVLVNFRLHKSSKTTTSQVGFRKEHHSLFYQMGVVAQNQKACKMISSIIEVNQTIPTDISNWDNRELCAKSFNYYLLKSADEFYASDELYIAKEFLKEIKKQWLAPADQKLFQSLKVKVKLPLSVIHFFRK